MRKAESRKQKAEVARRVFVALFLIALATAASACPVCYGTAQTPLTKGASNGVLFLLGIVGSVQVGFVALFVTFWKRAKALRVGAGSQPAHVLKLVNSTSEVEPE